VTDTRLAKSESVIARIRQLSMENGLGQFILKEAAKPVGNGDGSHAAIGDFVVDLLGDFTRSTGS
jgi:hypothetical protein